MINYRFLSWYFASLIIIFPLLSNAQVDVDSSRYDEVRSLVSFYNYMLNTVGDASTSTRDKEVIITESYKKVFANSTVQIEDDLLADRNAIVNKDVTAYLRDVDFFFKTVRFDFSELSVSKLISPEQSTYYLVAFQSTIDAKTLDGDRFKNVGKRYIEVNVDPQSTDLKIASVYTTKVSRERELRDWWESLTYEWTRIFQSYADIDNLDLETLEKIADLDSLNLSGNQMIMDVNPLIALRNLKYLDISNTKIQNLNPLRFAKNLKTFKAANTPIENLSICQYLENIEVLDLSNSALFDIKDIAHLPKLQIVNLSGNNISSFDPLITLTQIQSLNLSNTPFSKISLISENMGLHTLNVDRTSVASLEGIEKLNNLRSLSISEAFVVNLNPLEKHPSLVELNINRTGIKDISILGTLPKLKKVVADYSGVSEQTASAFMRKYPSVVVVTNSEKVMDWWRSLPEKWKEIFRPVMGVSNPQKEDIVRLLNTDSLDVSNQLLDEAIPLKKFKRLKYLDISKNFIGDFAFTQDMEDLETLKGTKLPITTCQELAQNKNLKVLNLESSLLTSVNGISFLYKLEELNLEFTQVPVSDIHKLAQGLPNTIIIYRTSELFGWWEDLSSNWKDAFDLEVVSSQTLHQLTQQREINIQDLPVSSLVPLQVFKNLRSVSLSNTAVASLDELSMHLALEKVICKNGPLQSLSSLENNQNLKYLDISNTAVADLRPLYSNKSIAYLDCSGTNIKRLKGLSVLKNLQYLNISNTRVWQLDRLYDIRNLKSLVCYNTRIREHKIEEFKGMFPECEVTYY